MPATAYAPRTNAYASPCDTCRVRVPAGEGHLTRVNGKWTVRHVDACPAPAAPAPAQRTITAVARGVYRHNGAIFVVKPSRQNRGRMYACELVESPPRVTEAGTEIPFELVYRSGVIYELEESERMPLAEAEQIATRYGRCFVCGARLKAAKSVRKAIGPVCEKYFAAPVPVEASDEPPVRRADPKPAAADREAYVAAQLDLIEALGDDLVAVVVATAAKDA